MMVVVAVVLKLAAMAIARGEAGVGSTRMCASANDGDDSTTC